MGRVACGVLLTLCVACCLVASSAQNVYQAFEFTDAPYEDIQWVNTTDMSELMTACNALAQCVGFNSNGWLKSGTSTVYSTTSFYLKLPATSAPNIWPLPQAYSFGTSALLVSYPLQFESNPPLDQFPDLQAAIKRYQDLIFQHHITNVSGQIASVSITVANTTASLQLGVDESYTLTIPGPSENSNTIQISAETVYGAYHALETLSQLIYFNFSQGVYTITSAPISIKDFPRFSHRGVLIDTSRHFQPVHAIFSMIDSLTYTKYNVLHWHIYDVQSFPMQSVAAPNLWLGSYSPEQRYTTQDMLDVVEYARQRGVRVMVEFDMPGHADSWCIGNPEVCPDAPNGCTSPLDPSNSATFTLIENMIAEVTGGAQGKGIFPDDLFHLGGDEVDTSCWTKTEHVQQWLTANNYTADQAYMYFVETAHDYVIKMGRDPVNWEEVFNNFGSKLDPRSIIHIWLDHATLAKVVAAGYRGILSNSDVWYLDHLNINWTQFYLNEPFESISDPKQQALVLGGETCMWGETVDASDWFNTVWPRAAAAAERLWSDQSVTDLVSAFPRLEWFRCLLTQRGIDAAPVSNSEARTAPPGPGSCYLQ